MNNGGKLYEVYLEARSNKWIHYFAIFCRIMLAIAFLISGFVKISGERFASGLPVTNPMGSYLEALHHTGFYYNFIGIAQVIIAILLLIPRTSLIGAILYFPIILNICILAYATRFEGTRITTFMVLASAFLLCWDFDKLKYLFKKKEIPDGSEPARQTGTKKKFPFLFFGGVIATLAAVVIINQYLYNIRPGNTSEECYNGCPGNSDPKACATFCDCIYKEGKTLKECLEAYEKNKK